MSNIFQTALYTTAQIRKIEQNAFDKIPPGELMERAGKAAYDFMLENWPLSEKIIVVCGPGNNGGDGYVLAKYADQAGFVVEVLATAPPKSEEAIAAAACCAGLIRKEVDFNCADLIIDAYLGIGLEGDKLKADAHHLIEEINQASTAVFSLDCPSGLNTDTGQALGVAVNAEATLTFIALKQGLFTGDGVAVTGRVACYPLGLEKEDYQDVTPNAFLYLMDENEPLLPPRNKASHKGDFGHLLVIGGNKGYGGAALMAAEGALRTGAGLVSLATRPEHISGVIAERPEIMAHGIENAGELAPLLDKATVVVLGPGLGQDEWARALFAGALKIKKPLLIDADALTLLSAQDLKPQSNWILTPHPGEAARLRGCETDLIQQDRFTAIRDLQRRYGGTIVLKGAGSLITGADGHVILCPYGNPGMASGGMGDVLSGIIAGLVAQGFENGEAAIWGVYIHALAADKAAKQGERGMIASDVLACVRALVG